MRVCRALKSPFIPIFLPRRCLGGPSPSPSQHPSLPLEIKPPPSAGPAQCPLKGPARHGAVVTYPTPTPPPWASPRPHRGGCKRGRTNSHHVPGTPERAGSGAVASRCWRRLARGAGEGRTVTFQVVCLVGPADGFGDVGRAPAATAVLCQEVRQGEGLALLVLLLGWVGRGGEGRGERWPGTAQGGSSWGQWDLTGAPARWQGPPGRYRPRRRDGATETWQSPPRCCQGPPRRDGAFGTLVGATSSPCISYFQPPAQPWGEPKLPPLTSHLLGGDQPPGLCPASEEVELSRARSRPC